MLGHSLGLQERPRTIPSRHDERGPVVWGKTELGCMDTAALRQWPSCLSLSCLILWYRHSQNTSNEELIYRGKITIFLSVGLYIVQLFAIWLVQEKSWTELGLLIFPGSQLVLGQPWTNLKGMAFVPHPGDLTSSQDSDTAESHQQKPKQNTDTIQIPNNPEGD